jgi:hypothetical protein
VALRHLQGLIPNHDGSFQLFLPGKRRLLST